MHLAHHRPHVIVLRHELETVETVIDGRLRVKHRQGHPGVRGISEFFFQKRRKVELRDQRLEFYVGTAEPLVEPHEFLLVILGGDDMLRTYVGHKAHQ